jgi:hypothetical protein
LEADIIKHLEETQGLILGEDLLYEPKFARSKWIDENCKSHTYIPDLYDVKNNIVYEVKPISQVRDESDHLRLKRLAVERRGFTFRYLTEVDLRKK